VFHRRRIVTAVTPLLAPLAALLCLAAPLAAQEPLDIPIVYITQQEAPRIPLSLIEQVPEDEGLAGARAAIRDNQTTGRLMKQNYELIERIVPRDGDLAAAMAEELAAGYRLFVADLHADQLLQFADLPDAADALIFNARAQDDFLRTDDCRANLLHMIPNRAMKTDALAQYLVRKKWTDLFLVHGVGDGDIAFAEAMKRSARKFNLDIVEERVFEDVAPSARTDSGHAQIQQQMAVFTQDVDDYDVLLVADESDIFGEYLPYRTWDPRPVVGTQGLVPTAWDRTHEQWGGTQMQRRFERVAHRWMVERDFAAWAAVRAIGEAVTRIGSAAPADIKAHLFGADFKLAAFKGEGLTFRHWDQQLRQPILLVGPRVLVSVSPQQGFLHQRSELDTLGFDEPDSKCRLNQ